MKPPISSTIRKEIFFYTWIFWVLSSAFKALLSTGYKSTDFEVHRHWLALTSSLPTNEWYFDETSEWTLDYPPVFAYFQYLLSWPAYLFDPKMLDIANLNYESTATVAYMRLTVIFSDLLLAFAAYRFVCAMYDNLESRKNSHSSETNHSLSSKAILIIALTLFCPGLLIVDHIHFQYNGFVLGALILSLSYLIEGKFSLGAIMFTLTVHLKHTFLFTAPVIAFFYLRNILDGKMKLLDILRVISCVILTIVISWSPFLSNKSLLTQIFGRMFPFGRGLMHSYWAPNFWTLYACMDKVLVYLLNILKISVEVKPSNTRGLVGIDGTFSVLPSITPRISAGLVFIMLVPTLYVMLTRKRLPLVLMKCVCFSNMSGFMFGWHVHEKAILLVIVPLLLMSEFSLEATKIFLILNLVGTVSLFPLLYRAQETSIRCMVLITYYLFYKQTLNVIGLKTVENIPIHEGEVGDGWLQSLPRFVRLMFYLISVSSILLEVYRNPIWGIHQYLFKYKYEFLPLLLTSVCCAVVICCCWLYMLSWLSENSESKVA